MHTWELHNVIKAHQTVAAYGITYEEAQTLLADQTAIERWLQAEARYRTNIGAWLAAERRFDLTRGDLNYVSAKQGWDKMRELNPNLDGVEHFWQLSPVLQDRYAVFAAGVLEG